MKNFFPGIFRLGFSLVGQRPSGRKGGKMKTGKSILAGLVLVGSMSGSLTAALGASGLISKDTATEGSYCHMKFPAIDEDTLGSEHPVLTDPGSGDIVDFYGSCDHDPLGKDEVFAQRLQLRQRR